MKADLIIPTYRPDDTFCLLLQKLQEQTFVVHRVIILNTEEKLWKEAVEKYPIEQSLVDFHVSIRCIISAKKCLIMAVPECVA